MTKFVAVFGLVLFLIGDSIVSSKVLPRVRDMEEIPDLFEGDIIIPPNGLKSLKNGMVGDEYRWPNATVVYEIDPTFSAEDIQKLQRGWEEIKNTTCMQFRPRRPQDKDFVFVTNGEVGSGCSSNVGRIGGQQSMNLAPSCVNRHGTIVHEMLHTIGFHHEQSRPDRDDFVTIIWDKIESGHEHNFNKYEYTEATTYGAPYDYGSVLHYSDDGFSIDGSPTIVPNIPGVTIGQRIGISQLDAGKVILMYNCTRID